MTSRRKKALLAALLLLFPAAILYALLSGQYPLDPEQVLLIIWSKLGGQPAEAVSKVQEVIVWNFRLPRVLLAIATGTALAAGGAAYQGCFRNPLVDPYILGASSGAACGAALAIIFPYIFPQGQLAAFICALAAVLLSYGLVRSRGQIPPMALVLSGIIVGALFSAMVGIMKYLAADTQLREITFWMMGGLHYATWADAALAMGAVLPIFLLLWRFGWQLNILSLGDEEARSLGLNPASARLLIIIAATFMSAICVSICGIIAWVGLMMPHAARMLFGPDHRWVIPGSALLGAIYLLFCDTIARTLIDSEIPLGIVTSVIGAPYLLWLLRSRGRAVYGL